MTRRRPTTPTAGAAPGRCARAGSSSTDVPAARPARPAGRSRSPVRSALPTSPRSATSRRATPTAGAWRGGRRSPRPRTPPCRTGGARSEAPARFATSGRRCATSPAARERRAPARAPPGLTIELGNRHRFRAPRRSLRPVRVRSTPRSGCPSFRRRTSRRRRPARPTASADSCACTSCSAEGGPSSTSLCDALAELAQAVHVAGAELHAT